MKKTVFVILALFAITGLFAQERIAIFPFEDRNNVYTKDELDSFYVQFSNEFRNKTDDRRFTVIPRDDLEKIINMEAKFQLSDYSSKEKTAEMNRVLNAQQILYCLILKVNNEIHITVSRRSFPELSVLRGGKTINVTNKNQLFGKIPELVQAMVNEIAGGTTSAQTNPTGNSTPAQTYKIGDTGPAGGIVFYDKGSFSDGWRYLEAAPANVEINIGSETKVIFEWGAKGQNVANTMTGVGFGKQNTQVIVDRLRSLGETNCAAQVCAALDINGYKDWFLPSRDELNLMYINRGPVGLGGFTTNYMYWSSSQANSNIAWAQSFGDGIQSYDNFKYIMYFVRAIRAF
jgi:hypothetical protein